MNPGREPLVDASVELLHMCTREEWTRAQQIGERIPDGFEAEGFVHMSTPAQVHLPANRIFAGRDDIVLLAIDPALLGGEVKYEPGVPSDPESMRFPHLYAPIPAAAVTAVVEYLPDANGVFAPVR